MTDSQIQTTSKKPNLIAYHVREGKGDDAFWNRIGAAWMNKDGLGYNLKLDSFPLNGEITLRPEKPGK